MNDAVRTIELVREGMVVVDAAGEELGKVEIVKFGDPGSATTAGGELSARRGRGVPAGEGLGAGNVFVAGSGVGGVAPGQGASAAGFAPVPSASDARGDEPLNVFEEPEPDVPEPLRSRLLRSGFVKIDGKWPGFMDTDRYAAAEQIAYAGPDGVLLSVRKEQLVAEVGGR